MNDVEVCVAALRQGHTPHEVAHAQGVSLSSVLGLLDRAVGEGILARSNIYFAISGSTRSAVEAACRERSYFPEPTRQVVPTDPVGDLLHGLEPDDVQVCLRYGPASRYFGDLYELVRRFEIELHGLVRDVLVKAFGNEKRAWWYRGVPVAVRKGCADRAEDVGRYDVDPWTCTYLLDMQTVMKSQWDHFTPLYKVGNRNEVFLEIKTVNDIRNRVMHPVRDAAPRDEDFDALRSAYTTLRLARERFYTP